LIANNSLPTEGQFVAGSANGSVELFPADELDLLLTRQSLAETGIVAADDTDRMQFDDVLGVRNELEDAAEGFSLKGSVESRHYDNFPEFGQFVRHFDDLARSKRDTYIREELALIDSHDLVLEQGGVNVFESGGANGLDHLFVVCCHLIHRVACVTLVFNDRTLILCYQMALDPPLQLCALPREHWPDYQLYVSVLCRINLLHYIFLNPAYISY
jgi:hypothetical protein